MEHGIPLLAVRSTDASIRKMACRSMRLEEIRNAIKFIEDCTGEKWDWDAYFECAKRFNAETRERLEWLDMSTTEYPQVIGANLALYTETVYMAIGGKVPAFLDADKKITKLAMDSYKKKEMIVPEYRHRAIIWGVQAQYVYRFPAVAAELLGHSATGGYVESGIYQDDFGGRSGTGNLRYGSFV